MPQYQFHNPQGPTYVEGWQKTNSGRSYLLRAVIPPGYPDQMPELLVIWPKTLLMHDGAGDLARLGMSHRFHVLGGTAEGNLAFATIVRIGGTPA